MTNKIYKLELSEMDVRRLISHLSYYDDVLDGLLRGKIQRQSGVQ